jgi:chromosome segregation protein
LKENAIKQTENEINQLTNQVFAAKNRMENLQAAQQNGLQRLGRY